jgi:hypothetical protein
MWKKVAVAEFKALSHCLKQLTQKNHENIHNDSNHQPEI